MYGGLGITFFFLVLFLQQVAGYDALQAGLATLPTTIVMFLLSKRAGRLADRFGPRLFMGFGPLVAAVGLALMQRIDATPDYWSDVFPALLVFSLGLSATVAPLTATVLADADEQNAGIASGVNNAVARVASLLAVARWARSVSASFSVVDRQQPRRPPAERPRRRPRSWRPRSRRSRSADTSGLPAAERAPVAAAVTRRLRRRLPPRHGPVRRARGARRPPRPRRHRQPAPRQSAARTAPAASSSPRR